jgi:hypothetical protein
VSDKPVVRFEIPLPAPQVDALKRLSERTGVRPRDLARLAITQLLACPERLVAGQPQAT